MKTHAEAKKSTPSRTLAAPVPNALAHKAQLRKALLRAGVQPRLKIGAINDPLEREADVAAERVMRMPKPATLNLVQPKTAAAPTSATKASTSQASPQLESSLNSLNAGGSPLDAQSRAFFEPRFGQDFSQVRLHTDSAAGHMATSLNAKAFTLGNHIAFAPSSSHADRNLLGHELAHVIQQQSIGGGIAQEKRVQRGPSQKITLPTGLVVSQSVHQVAIEKVLGKTLDRRSLNLLNEQQGWIDGLQRSKDQPLHAMTGMNMAEKEAIQAANRFVREELAQAHKLNQEAAGLNANPEALKLAALQKPWLTKEQKAELDKRKKAQPDLMRDEAMKHLGNAIHTLQDAVSVSHRGFQRFNPVDLIGTLKHVTDEAFYPERDSVDRAQLEGAVRWAYHIFKTGEIPSAVFNESSGTLLLPRQFNFESPDEDELLKWTASADIFTTKAEKDNSPNIRLGGQFRYTFNENMRLEVGTPYWEYKIDRKNLIPTTSGGSLSAPALWESAGIGSIALKLKLPRETSLELGVRGSTKRLEGELTFEYQYAPKTVFDVRVQATMVHGSLEKVEGEFGVSHSISKTMSLGIRMQGSAGNGVGGSALVFLRF